MAEREDGEMNVVDALKALLELIDRDAEANDANYATIMLEEPEVVEAREVWEANQ
jgi:hypothetical protein